MSSPPASLPHTIGCRGLYGRTLEGPTDHSATSDRLSACERSVGEGWAKLAHRPARAVHFLYH